MHTTVDGATTISVGDQVTGSSAGVLAESSGSGTITSNGRGRHHRRDRHRRVVIHRRDHHLGLRRDDGTAGRAIDAQITDAAANAAITLTRSGPVSSVGAFAGIYAENKGGGAVPSVDMYGLGAVSSVGAEGIRAAATRGASGLVSKTAA